jgi:ParB family transcriptional regulator, chromosome partitioning protein
MKIKLELIHPSPKPIRSSWDEEKLDELVQSIKEQGLIVPIKVRPKDGQYEIVYGHRRVEACRLAGLTEIECIVEELDDGGALSQALTENVVREEVNPYEIAQAFQAEINQLGQTLDEVGKKYGMKQVHVAEYLSLLRFDESILREITQRHVTYAILGAGDDKDVVPGVLKKAADEGLSIRQTRQIAEAVAATKDPRMRERLLHVPYDPYTHNPEMARERAKRFGTHDPVARGKAISPGELWATTEEVRDLLEYFKSSKEMAEETVRMSRMGKFAPEVRGFIARKAQVMLDAWQLAIDKLNE